MTMMSGWGPGGSDGPVGGNPTFRRCLANTRPIRPLHSRDHNDRRHHLPHKIINTNPRHCYKIAVWPGWKLMNFIEGYFCSSALNNHHHHHHQWRPSHLLRNEYLAGEPKIICPSPGLWTACCLLVAFFSNISWSREEFLIVASRNLKDCNSTWF